MSIMSKISLADRLYQLCRMDETAEVGDVGVSLDTERLNQIKFDFKLEVKKTEQRHFVYSFGDKSRLYRVRLDAVRSLVSLIPQSSEKKEETISKSPHDYDLIRKTIKQGYSILASTNQELEVKLLPVDDASFLICETLGKGRITTADLMDAADVVKCVKAALASIYSASGELQGFEYISFYRQATEDAFKTIKSDFDNIKAADLNEAGGILIDFYIHYLAEIGVELVGLLKLFNLTFEGFDILQNFSDKANS